MSIVDAHVHIGDFKVFGVSIDYPRLLRLMDEYGIVKAVASSLPNALTKKAVEDSMGRIAGLLRVDPRSSVDVNLIRVAIEEWGFKGVKLNPLFNNFLPDGEEVNPTMNEASRLGVPVLIHCGHPPWSLPWSFERLADRYPNVTIVMAHMGHGHIVYINGALDVAEGHDNIVVDTAGCTMHTKIKEAVERLGEDRVMYGSDTPMGHPAWEIPKVRVSGLDGKQLKRVLHDNAIRIYDL